MKIQWRNLRMRKLPGLLVAILVLILPAMAQEKSTQQAPAQESTEKEKPQQPTFKYELEGGYTYRSYYPPSAARFGMNGWNATLDYNWKHWMGFVADATGTYKDQGAFGKSSIYTLMVGPRVHPFGHRHRLTPFGQFLIGAGYDRQQIPNNGGFNPKTNTSTAYVWAAGGGIDVRVTKRWAVRAFEYDYEKTHFSDFLKIVANPSESNRRITVGIIFRWGESD
jgi:opacity protein-like surface antigen